MDIATVLIEALKALPAIILGGYPIKVIVDFIKSLWKPDPKLIPWLASLTGGIVGVFYALSGVPVKPDTMESWLFIVIYLVAGLLSGQVARVYWDNAKAQIADAINKTNEPPTP